MDEDQILSSIIADPDLVDPSIDVSKLKQTTDNPLILGDVPEFTGLQFDPRETSYIEDLYSIYGGGLPTIDVAQDPTTMIPQIPVIDTPIDAGGGGGGSGLTLPYIDVDSPKNTLDTTIRDQLIDEGIQAAEDDKGDMMLDEGVPVGEAYPPIDTVDYSELDDLEADIGAQAIKDFEPEQQNLIDLAFSKVGSTANDVINDLSQIPGAVVDFVNQTVDIAGKKINVGATLLKAGINKIVGGPITLVFDALSAAGLEGGPTLQTQKAQSIGLAGEGEYQDKYGINTQSMLGDYDQYNIDRVEQLEGIVADQKSKDLTNTIQMRELEDRKEYNKISGVGGDVEGDQEGITTAENIAAEARAKEEGDAKRLADLTGNTDVDIVDEQAVKDAIERAEAQQLAEQATAKAERDFQEAVAQAEREQRAREETDARMAAEAASRAAAAAANREAARRNQGGGNGGGGQNTGGARGGGTSATSAGLGGLGFSDIRLKDNVELIGKSSSNINIYKFNYKGDSTVYEGVIANEVPWASVKANNGYLMVDYNKIDVEFKKYDKK